MTEKSTRQTRLDSFLKGPIDEYLKGHGFTKARRTFRKVAKPFLCRLGLHHYVDFPDPNTETGGLEKQGYVACTRCSKEKDKRTYLSRSGRMRLPDARHPYRPEGHPLHKGKNTEGP